MLRILISLLLYLNNVKRGGRKQLTIHTEEMFSSQAEDASEDIWAGQILNIGEIIIRNWEYQWTVEAWCYPPEYILYLIGSIHYYTEAKTVIYFKIANSEISGWCDVTTEVI